MRGNASHLEPNSAAKLVATGCCVGGFEKGAAPGAPGWESSQPGGDPMGAALHTATYPQGITPKQPKKGRARPFLACCALVQSLLLVPAATTNHWRGKAAVVSSWLALLLS